MPPSFRWRCCCCSHLRSRHRLPPPSRRSIAARRGPPANWRPAPMPGLPRPIGNLPRRGKTRSRLSIREREDERVRAPPTRHRSRRSRARDRLRLNQSLLGAVSVSGKRNFEAGDKGAEIALGSGCKLRRLRPTGRVHAPYDVGGAECPDKDGKKKPRLSIKPGQLSSPLRGSERTFPTRP